MVVHVRARLVLRASAVRGPTSIRARLTEEPTRARVQARVLVRREARETRLALRVEPAARRQADRNALADSRVLDHELCIAGAGFGLCAIGIGAACVVAAERVAPVSYTHLRAHETPEHLVCRL